MYGSTSGGGEEGQGASATAGFQMLLGGISVVSRDCSGVEDFLKGVLAGLAVLPLDQAQNLPLALQHQIVETAKDLRSHLEGVVVSCGTRPGARR